MKCGMRTVALLTSLTLVLGSTFVHAQDYPKEPVRLMVGYAPGGGTDVTARVFAREMATSLGQAVVVENRPGASGTIAAEQVARANPDGYRLLMIASGTFIHDVLAPKGAYDIFRDFTPISLVTVSPLVIVVGPSTSIRTYQDLIDRARAKQASLSFSSDGPAGTVQLAGELFASMAKVKLLHVPYKGASEAITAVASGQVDIGFPSIAAARPMLQAGKVRPIAVTSLQRSAFLPEVPTLNELGLRGYDVVGWFALLGPAGLPRPVVNKLNAALGAAASSSAIKDTAANQGLEVKLGTPEQLTAYLRAQAELISGIGKEANIKVD